MGSKIVRVPVNPQMMRWARERGGVDIAALEKAFPRLEAWERGDVLPTLKQLERFAKVVRVPFGFLFLDSPPDEPLPIPDFRTMSALRLKHPSPDLLDTIYLCQQRQEWYRSYAQALGEKPLPFVGSASLQDDVVLVAAGMRRELRLDIEERRKLATWTEALRRFVERAEMAGLLVMVSGIVGNNTHRTLDPEEFRGFALVDDLAPLIFVNAADTKSGQMFTLAHELAHIWLGESGVSDAQITTHTDEKIERWCNQVAAEVLVPLEVLKETYRPEISLSQEMGRLARMFKVSTLVILRRFYDAGVLNEERFWQAYREERERLRQFEGRGGTGGDFYRTLNVRVSKRFAQAAVVSTLEGQTLFRDAFQMLGIHKQETFDKFVETLGMA
ncbi:MAG: ImmA/IrrE family metallo-endopeptidase [Calditrichaeota bacterium]|nr:MAG: ImmA/IrrE family metallo-endopeptidase [Calditrichota bacterium]